MTGLLLFLLLLAAIAAGLEAQHRHVRRLGPQVSETDDHDLVQRRRELAARTPHPSTR